ncbi:hypothetical protein [Streptomyces sp. NPDC048225]|uniref:hypothetical protein n=1 Tax=Streptomyces sp. NPDC048225 TaxID=3365518 RepID=UPI0037140264
MTLVPAVGLASAQDCCPVCHGPVEGEAQWWTQQSRHHTSEGEVEYCTGGCGCLVVLLDGELLKAVPGTRR